MIFYFNFSPPEHLDTLRMSFSSSEVVWTVCEIRVACEVLCMRDSYYVWLGMPGSRRMGNLAAAFANRFGSDPTTATTLLAESGNEESGARIARRLTQKTGMAMFVSYNVAAGGDAIMLEAVMRKAVEYVAGLVASADAAAAATTAAAADADADAT